MATLYEPYLILGPRGERLYPSPREAPAKFRRLGALPRQPTRAVRPRDWNEMVTLAAKLVASDPCLMGALRQRAEWAFAGDSWQPIYHGQHTAWGDEAAAWLKEVVYPNAVAGNVRRDLVKAMQVSAMSWAIHGGDLALFQLGPGNLPQMRIIPGTMIGNGDPKNGWSDTLEGDSYRAGDGVQVSGFGLVTDGPYAGLRIYNGLIYDDSDEPVAVRVLGWRRGRDGWRKTYADLALGFAAGAHFASEYDWHGLGRPLPRIAASLIRWQQKYQIDESLLRAIELTTHHTVIHKLPAGQDVVGVRGNVLTPLELSASETASGNAETIWVEYSPSGEVCYIGADENIEGITYENPHPNVEEFARRVRGECLLDLGWPQELTDLNSTGRAPTRLACELVNNSLWQTQCAGEVRLLWFVRYAIAVGIRYGHIPAPPAGPLEEPYRWTFGYPREMSVDQGNDVTASLNRLRMGLTSKRIESARWGYVLDYIRRDRLKETLTLIEDADAVVRRAAALGHALSFESAIDLLYQSGPNPTRSAARPVEAAAGRPADSQSEEATPSEAIPTP